MLSACMWPLACQFCFLAASPAGCDDPPPGRLREQRGSEHTQATQTQITRAPMKGHTQKLSPLTREESYSNFPQTKQLSETGPPMLRGRLDPCISARLRSASSTLGGRVHLIICFEVVWRGFNTCVAFLFARLILNHIW